MRVATAFGERPDLRRLAADLKGLGFDADAIEGAIGQKSPKEIT